MNKDFANESPKKDMPFYLVLLTLLVFSFMGFGIDYDEFTQKTDINIPGGYFYMIFLVDFLMIVGLTLIFFYKKAGIILFPLALLTHFFMHSFFLSTFLYTDVTNLFVFITFGLLAFIPKWQFFR